MKKVRHVLPLFALLALLPVNGFSASAEIEKALSVLLADYNIEDFLQVDGSASEDELSSGFYRVKPGDTLDAIITRLVGDSPLKKQALRDAFVQANPNSFRNRNPNYLLAGGRLRLPKADDILALLFDMDSPAVRQLQDSREGWVQFP